MKYLKYLLMCCVIAVLGITKAIAEGNDMKIKLTFDNKEVFVRMDNNSVVKQFLETLPAKFDFRDFNGEEKISEFIKPIDLTNAPRGMVASQGKMFIYAPWGNFGFFYKNHDTKIDKSLIPMGEVESGIENLMSQNKPFSAQIEIINN